MTLYKLFFKNMTLWFTKHQEMIKGATRVDQKTMKKKGRNRTLLRIQERPQFLAPSGKNMH